VIDLSYELAAEWRDRTASRLIVLAARPEEWGARKRC